MLKQKGFSLIFVLAILIVVSFLVASGMRTINTETAVSGGEVDKSVAFHYAETAADYISKIKLVEIDDKLQKGEISLPPDNQPGCTSDSTYNGICVNYTKETTPAWQKNVGDENILDSCLGSSSFSVNKTGGECEPDKPGNVAWKNPRYIIEPMSDATVSPRIYRVTIKAWGKNENTSTIIQAYYSLG